MPERLRGRPSPSQEPRLALRSRDELDGASLNLHDTLVSGSRTTQSATIPLTDERGRLLGPFAIMLVTPDIGMVLQELGTRFRFSRRLTRRETELAVLVVAASTGSEFEWTAHESAARSAGITNSQLQALLDGATLDHVSRTEAAVIDATRSLVLTRTLDDDEFQYFESVLGREYLAELVWLVGYYHALALALHVFRPASPGK